MGYKKIALVLAAIGAINWGLTELGWNAVEGLVGSWSGILVTIIYYIIGLCGIYAIIQIFK